MVQHIITRAQTPHTTNKSGYQLRSQEMKEERSKRKNPQQQNVSNTTLILGPITRLEHEKVLHRQMYNESASSSQDTSSETTTNTDVHMLDHVHTLDQDKHTKKTIEAFAPIATTKPSPIYRVLISLDIILICLLLVRRLPLDTISSFLQELWTYWNSFWTGYLVAASSIEEMESPSDNSTMYYDTTVTSSTVMFVMSMIKHGFYPFLLFLPSLVVLSAAVASLTTMDMDATRRKTLSFISISSAGMFIFLSVMVAFAETSRWILLGVTSVVGPVVLMLLARLSVVNANQCIGDVYIQMPGTWSTDGLHWSSSVAKDCQHFASTTIKLIGFVFAFLPFLAGFMYLVSPPYLLVIPVSSLTTCTITGIFGIMPMLISIAVIGVGAKVTLWTMTKIFRVYSWAVNKSFAMLLFLTCLALLMSTRELNIPSYL